MTAPVAVTGIGIIGPVGPDRETFWSNLCAGRSGLDVRPELAEFEGIPVGRLAAGTGAPAWDAPGRALAMADVSMREALAHSGLVLDDGSVDLTRLGVFLGTCSGTTLGDPPDLAGQGPIPQLVHGQAMADELARGIAARGPALVVNTACSAGANAMSIAAEYLHAGHVDVALAGGADELSFWSHVAFSAVSALDDDFCGPYSRSQGLNLGEGAAFLVLEPLDRAWFRGATVLAVLAGSGLSSDAHHPVAPDPTGAGPRLAVDRALAQAGVAPEGIDHVNGHGTATPANDAMEAVLFDDLFGARRVPVTGIKGATGHAFGGSSAMEAAATVLALDRGVVPPTARGARTEGGPDVVVEARPLALRCAVSNSYGFGGNNASLLFLHADADVPALAAGEVPVAVTALGAVVDGALEDGDGAPLARPDDVSARGWRRMDRFAREAVAATTAALARRSGPDLRGRDDVAVLVATDTGPADTWFGFHNAARRGRREVNPVIVANTVMSSTAGHLATEMGWRGPTSTFVAGWTAGIDAAVYARRLLATGGCGAVVLVTGDVPSPDVDATYRDGAEGPDALPLRDATVAVVLEPATGSGLGVVRGGSVMRVNPGDDVAQAWATVVARALADAAVPAGHVGVVVSSAGGGAGPALTEATAAAVLGGRAPAFVRPKDHHGEVRAGQTGLALAAATGWLAGTEGPEVALVAGHDPGGGIGVLVLGRDGGAP